MDIDTDFRTLTERQVAELLVASVADMDDEHTACTLTVDLIVRQVKQGHAVVVAERDAIAVVRPEGYRPIQGDPVLWLLFVRPTCRGTGVGNRPVRPNVTSFWGNGSPSGHGGVNEMLWHLKHSMPIAIRERG